MSIIITVLALCLLYSFIYTRFLLYFVFSDGVNNQELMTLEMGPTLWKWQKHLEMIKDNVHSEDSFSFQKFSTT